MIYIAHIIMAVLIILGQSIMLPMFFHYNGFYDFFIPLVVYLSIFRSRWESILLLFLSGVMMDSISGGVTGVYLLTYLWLWMGLKLAILYLDKENLVLQLGAVFIGILMETGFFWAAGVLPGGAYLVGRVVWQLILSAITAPIFLVWWRGFVEHLPRSLPRREKNTVTGFFLDRLL